MPGKGTQVRFWVGGWNAKRAREVQDYRQAGQKLETWLYYVPHLFSQRSRGRFRLASPAVKKMAV